MQGAYLQKGFEKHGPLSNPYAFGYFPPMPNPPVERFTHNFIIYDGGALPDHYRGKLFGIEPLQGRVVETDIEADGSTFGTFDIGHPVTTSDQWFRPVDIKVGPDGAIYLADWYDAQVNHYRNHEGQIDKSNGRIYRLKAKGAKPIQPFDLSRLSTQELVDLLGHTNKWFRQEALRLIGDRKDKSVIPTLKNLVDKNTGQLALESFWALNLSGGFDDETAIKTLDHNDPFVRMWTVRLLGDEQEVSPAIAKKLVAVAAVEPNVEVRAQLACSAKRLPAADALPIVRELLGRNEDPSDKRIPLLLWWAMESKCEQDRGSVFELFSDSGFWRLPLVQSNILERVMRRYAMAGTRRDLLTCAQLLRLSPGPEQTARLIAGFEEAFKGRSVTTLPDELLEAMAKSGGKSVILGLRRGDAGAVDAAIREITNPAADAERRREYIEILGEVKQARVLPILLNQIANPNEAGLHSVVLTALQHFDDPSIAKEVIGHFGGFDDDTRPAALELLSSRPEWTQELLEAVEVGKIPKSSISQDVLRKIKTYPGKSIVKLVNKYWGGERVATTAEMQEEIKHCAAAIRDGTGDPYKGRSVFMATCGVCHKLFGQGGQIGPDLTSYKRDDLDTMLLNIVNPSAEIREGYENYLVTTKDGRTLSGFLADKDNQVVVLRGLDAVNEVLPRDQISEMKSSGVSLMPQGLLESFNDQRVRDLFAYLRSSQPLVGSPPTKSSASRQ
jgi:putative heme-binding domain-containing protein